MGDFFAGIIFLLVVCAGAFLIFVASALIVEFNRDHFGMMYVSECAVPLEEPGL